MLGFCKNPKCTYDHAPNQKNLENSWIKNVCDVFREPVKWITNHDTPFPVGDLGVEMAEIVEMEERVVAMNATEAKSTKMTILDEQVVVAAETTTATRRGRRQEKSTLLRAHLRRGHGKHTVVRAPAASVPHPSKLWVISVCCTVGN